MVKNLIVSRGMVKNRFFGSHLSFDFCKNFRKYYSEGGYPPLNLPGGSNTCVSCRFWGHFGVILGSFGVIWSDYSIKCEIFIKMSLSMHCTLLDIQCCMVLCAMQWVRVSFSPILLTKWGEIFIKMSLSMHCTLLDIICWFCIAQCNGFGVPPPGG